MKKFKGIIIRNDIMFIWNNYSFVIGWNPTNKKIYKIFRSNMLSSYIQYLTLNIHLEDFIPKGIGYFNFTYFKFIGIIN